MSKLSPATTQDPHGSVNQDHALPVGYGASFPPQPLPYAASGGEAALPSPSPYSIDQVPGYENVTLKNATVTPPTVPDLTEEPQPERRDMANIPHFTEEDVREAVIRLASENCCYGSAVAREMQVTEIAMNSAFRYTLETFGEKRESAWRFVPYVGQHIDGLSNGPAPAAWDIPVRPRENFKGGQTKVEVPHTAFVKPCHVCVGNGRVRCETCKGKGRLNSSSAVFPDRCSDCSGTGQETCGTCRGRCNLKGYVQLIVTWKNHMSEYISQTTAMPKELVRNATGQMVLHEDKPRVMPVNHAADNLVNVASKNIVQKHSMAFPNERIIRQRHRLQIVPIALCSYKWKDKSGTFCVYGFDQKVYFPEYPQECCCGCNIL